MKSILTLLAGIVVGAAGAWWFLHPRDEPGETRPAAAAEVPAGVVRLDRARQAAAGIAVTSPEPRELPRETKGYGRVLDPAPLAAAFVDLDTAEAMVDASRREYERLKALFARDQNASARAVESAGAALRRDEAQWNGVRARMTAAWGRPLIERPDLRALVQALVNHEAVLVRIDVPISEALDGDPTGARLVSLAGEERSAEAGFAGFATAADPHVQGRGFLFLLRENALGLRPDMAVVGHVKTGRAPLSGFVVPGSAVVRAEGEAWIFIQQDETTFRRRAVELDRPVEDGWFIAHGLESSDRIVTKGAQILLSEQGRAGLRVD